MKTIKIPYYTSSLDLHVDEKNLEAVITARTDEYEAGKSEEELVKEALEHPIGTPRLSELAKGKNRIVLVTSDHTRAVPSKLTLPLLLAEIRKGNPDADITILIATGLHRPTTEAEQRRMFGDPIVDHEKIAVNKAFEPDDFAYVTGLPSGAEPVSYTHLVRIKMDGGINAADLEREAFHRFFPCSGKMHDIAMGRADSYGKLSVQITADAV